jgi:hypothetical protein
MVPTVWAIWSFAKFLLYSRLNNKKDGKIIVVMQRLYEGHFTTIKEIAECEKENNIDYIKKAVRLNILSPKIIESILAGKQPEDLTVEKLCAIKTLDRNEQERQLNLA